MVNKRYNSLWLWKWLPHRLSKRQLLSTTVLFRTTLIRTIDAQLTYESRICWQSKQTSLEQLLTIKEFIVLITRVRIFFPTLTSTATATFIFCNQPVQMRPSPKYPSLQTHSKYPAVFKQVPFPWQLWLPILHSSTSVGSERGSDKFWMGCV